MELPAGFDAEKVRAGLGLVGCERTEDLYLTAPHETHSDGGLLVGLQLGLEEELAADDLVLPAGGFVVAVDGGGGVVEHDEGGL